MKVLITGANGFVGKNLVENLKIIREGKIKHKLESKDIYIYEYDRQNTIDDLEKFTNKCDFVIHLAGVNRPQNNDEFYKGNKGFTETLCENLKKSGNKCPILISSSIQVGKDNDYARSKKEGENLLLSFGKEYGNPIYIYRFANLFGKWCRPNYNSVVATWCHNIANHLDIQINDENAVLYLCYIDDVINEILNFLCGNPNYDAKRGYYTVIPEYKITLGNLAQIIQSFKASRNNLNIPNQSDELKRKLYATYLSYLPEHEFSYPLKMNIDERGSFTEFLHTKEYGQVSVNISKPGITKGNHWHNTKNEKFLVVYGKGLIRFRKIGSNDIYEYYVSGEILEVVDIPIGYTHCIINIGESDLVTVMWANETFDSDHPDTYYEKV